MENIKFKVVPLCNKQKLDINITDILNNGLYRKCNVYKGGGGYDKFPYICEKRLGFKYNNQFVVQLYGCPLKCPYCYVTQGGIFGKYIEIDTEEMIRAFENSEQDIFHLMGGAPALYLENWNSIIDNLNANNIFHSDFLLIEKEYDLDVLKSVNKKNTLYAVSIKGINEEFKQNTGVEFNNNLFWNNLNKIIESKINFYFTFTGINENSVNEFKNECKSNLKQYSDNIFDDSFIIDIIKYNALD